MLVLSPVILFGCPCPWFDPVDDPEEDDEGNFEEPKKERIIEDPSPVNKVEPIPEGASFFIFSQDNSLRIFCHWLQGHPIMGNFILVCIIVSSALLACEDPLKSQSDINNVSQIARKQN